MKPYTLILLTSILMLLLWGSCSEVVKPPDNGGGPDTTSHDFTFETFVLGDGNSSILYDVAIINDTLAYAVGEISVKDTNGEFINPPYNVARWNGQGWELLIFMSDAQILYPGSIGDSLLFAYGHAIFARGPNDIWIAAGNIHHFDGTGWTQMQAEYAGFSNKMWGDDAGRLWCVGSNGTIIYYDGNTWQKIESGTTVNIRDIWGISSNQQTDARILAVAPSPEETKVLSIINESVAESFPWHVGLAGVWISPNSSAYLSGVGGVWVEKDTGWQIMGGLPDSIIFAAIRGNSDYDIFLDARKLMHFNGNSWLEYLEIPTEVNIQSIAVKQDLVVAVGLTVSGGVFADKAAIVVGKR